MFDLPDSLADAVHPDNKGAVLLEMDDHRPVLPAADTLRLGVQVKPPVLVIQPSRVVEEENQAT